MKRAACTLLLVAGACQAQDGMGMGPRSSTALGGMLGLGVLNGPRYLGADESRTRAVPLVQLHWGEGWFAGNQGIGYQWGGDSTWSGGLRLGYDRGRRERDSAALRGLGDIPSRAEAGAFTRVRLLPFLMVDAGLRYGSGEDHDGLLMDVGLRTMIPVASSVRLGVGFGGTWANAAAMRSGFGVDATQAGRSGYALYQPDAGWRDWGPSAMAMVDLGGSWQLMLKAEHKRLIGDAKASPLVRQANGTSALVTIGKRF